MEDYEKIETEAIKKLAPGKSKMKISGKSSFLLARLSKEAAEESLAVSKENDKKISEKG